MIITESIIRLRNRYRRDMSVCFGRCDADVRPRFPVISFTFDDFPRSALHVAGSILKQNGVRGTYYVSMGLMDQTIPAGTGFSASDLRQTVVAGHELGCHTFHHCHAWETSPQEFEASILANQKMLQHVIPGATFKTLSYPISCPRPETKRRAAGHFLCSRGGGESFNLGITDRNNLQAVFLEKNTTNEDGIKRLIQDNGKAKGWLIFATHDVEEKPSPFGCTPAFFETVVKASIESGAPLLPVGEAWETINSMPSVPNLRKAEKSSTRAVPL